jgi:hypothetical protein
VEFALLMLGAMVVAVLVLGGMLAALMLVWWVRRHQRDIDYEQREHREPPVFLSPGGGPDGGTV